MNQKLKERLEHTDQNLKYLQSILSQTKFTVQKIKNQLQELQNEKTLLNEAQLIAINAGREVQKNLEIRLTPIVNAVLSAVMIEDEYSLSLEYNTRGTATKLNQIKFVLTKNGIPITNLLKEESGGVLQLIAMALRWSFVLLNSTSRRILILDEPVVALSTCECDYQVKFKDILMKLVEEFTFQIIMSTHSESLKSGNLLNLSEIGV